MGSRDLSHSGRRAGVSAELNKPRCSGGPVSFACLGARARAHTCMHIWLWPGETIPSLRLWMNSSCILECIDAACLTHAQAEKHGLLGGPLVQQCVSMPNT